MPVAVDDVRIELRKDELSDQESEFIERKIEEYSLRASKINPKAPDHIKDEYVLAGVLQAFLTDYTDEVSSFSDGRFSITKASIMENPVMERFKKALLKLQGIRVWKP